MIVEEIPEVSKMVDELASMNFPKSYSMIFRDLAGKCVLLHCRT